ncbi:MAG: hypothetical protein HF962_06100 [Sulfurovum sp.]|nr:hypothetical protein [Sulfurovum sp.]
MKKTLLVTVSIGILAAPSILSAEQAKGLNVIVNSADPQTQTMAMVLSTKSLLAHKKKVNIVLCGPAGDLADKNIQSIAVEKPSGKALTVKKHLRMLINKGATVEVCPLYLPNASKDKSVLIKGITVAKPGQVAARLLDKDYKNISF